jgi:aryl-alcohol dehydrogenase-like predicted oxidoreductase
MSWEGTLETRNLGRTGLTPSLLTFGCGAVGGLMTKGDPADQKAAFEKALAAGVTFFDTAPLYGNGASETNVGRLLAELKPDITLGTKVDVPDDAHGAIGAAIRQSLEQSLARLGRDSVDVFQLHNRISADGQTRALPAERVLNDVADTFDQLKQEGLIRFAGFTAIGDTDALHAVVTSGRFDTAQVVYNALNPSAGRAIPAGYPGQDYKRLLDVAEANGVGTIVIRSIAGGALSGTTDRHPLGMANVAPIGSGSDYAEDVERALKLQPLVAEAGAASLIELGIRYVMAHPSVSTLQVGMATVAEFEGALAAVEKGPLPADVVRRIEEVQATFV